MEKFNYTDSYIRELYNHNYHKNQWNIFRYKNLNTARIIYETIEFNSVVDFGCSVGTYLEFFLSKGINIKGFEYCYDECLPFIKNIDGLEDNIEFGDVSKIINTEKKYDLSISTEVAEHIPTSKSDFLVNNLCDSSSKFIFFTAAKIGQGGTGHINCQPKDFWIKKFEERGWYINKKMEIIMKNKMIPNNDLENKDYPIVWQFIYNNMMFFEKKMTII